MKNKAKNLEALVDLYLNDKISIDTLCEVAKPMDGLPLEQRDYIASKIIGLVNGMTSEKDLIVKASLASSYWLEDISKW